MIKVLAYGSGNVRAITNIYNELGIECGVATSPATLDGATKVILPGVGAFDQTMSLLRQSGMLSRLNQLVLSDGIPVLGVCVGMQIMADCSEEGKARGLSWIGGKVVRIDTEKLSHKPLLPHMGWNEITPAVRSPIFADVDLERGFYFLHSYHFVCDSDDCNLATTTYGSDLTAAVAKGNIFGFQFHPEKSHQNGINLLRNFARL